MEHPKPRKQNSRRLTEISQNSVKLVDEFPEKEVPPVVPGEIFEYLSRMISPEKCSKAMLFHSAIKLLKVSTSSTWTEIFQVKKSVLKNIDQKKQTKFLKLDETDNLPAYTVIRRHPVLLTNPHTSTLYTRFPNKLQGFSVLTQQQVKLYSTATVPLYVFFI
jgi:hypothetical protein